MRRCEISIQVLSRGGLPACSRECWAEITTRPIFGIWCNTRCICHTLHNVWLQSLKPEFELQSRKKRRGEALADGALSANEARRVVEGRPRSLIAQCFANETVICVVHAIHVNWPASCLYDQGREVLLCDCGCPTKGADAERGAAQKLIHQLVDEQSDRILYVQHCI